MSTLREILEYTPNELRFGTSGLRGLASDMTDLECYINTVGFLRSLGLDTGEKIYLAGDLRESTPRILQAVHQAITDQGYKTVYCGLVPTPTVAYYARQQNRACIMVTGSHIPANRNGIKFYKQDGEVLKSDESSIKSSVATVRQQLYETPETDSQFTPAGLLKNPIDLTPLTELAKDAYMNRYTSVFASDSLAGKKIVVYQQSAVGRDIITDVLTDIGAEIIPVGRSDTFVPLDSENVTTDDRAYFRQLIKEHPDAFAIISTDGDSDRPLVVDEKGTFHRGDMLGAVVAEWLDADFSAYPVSTNDAVDMHLSHLDIPYEHTKIGSPYVIEAMRAAINNGAQRATGWEVNGGFLVGSDMELNKAPLLALQTRDALFPIIVALRAAIEKDCAVSDVFARLPQRFTQAGLIDEFPVVVSQKIIQHLSGSTEQARTELNEYFVSDDGFGQISDISTQDGIRIFFDNGDIAHLRPSGNAPQFRVYSVAGSQERADEIVKLAIAEPNGILRKLESKYA